MYLSGQSIRDHIGIIPFHKRTTLNGMSFGLSHAGYDIRVREELDMAPGDFVLASAFEHIVMPNNVIGFIKDKSTLARLGVALQNTVIEPGWRGNLTLEISNHGRERVCVPAGSPIAQILFARIDKPCIPYDGKYQDQGAAPQQAIFEE